MTGEAQGITDIRRAAGERRIETVRKGKRQKDNRQKDNRQKIRGRRQREDGQDGTASGRKTDGGICHVREKGISFVFVVR